MKMERRLESCGQTGQCVCLALAAEDSLPGGQLMELTQIEIFQLILL
jgi:hypothetical protein